MRTTFVRTLAVVAIVQFAITRTMAGNAIEEGRAERMWMMYPLNVVMNALAWTLVFAAFGRARRIFRAATD
jgi:uncharacterized membrane protein